MASLALADEPLLCSPAVQVTLGNGTVIALKYLQYLSPAPFQLMLAAIDMAITMRQPRRGLIHHSDHGCQYTSYAFGKRCQEAGIMPSMGTVGDAYDNAMAESFFASLECELLERRSFQTKTEARLALFSYIEGWYNPRRRHSALGYRSPVNFEKEMLADGAVPASVTPKLTAYNPSP